MTSLPPKQWISEAGRLELKDLEPAGSFLRYKSHTVDKHGDQTRDVLQSKDGSVARLISRDGRPLTSEEDSAERQRLQAMLASPDAFTKHIRSDDSARKNGMDIIKLVPDAMVYTYATNQPQRPRATTREVVLDFTPDPKWDPPTMIAGALTGLQGRMWIDPQSRHLTRLEATVFKPTNLGWGLIGHVYPGGTLVLEEVHAAESRWIYSHFAEHITARAMMVKTVKENAEVEAYGFKAISAMSYQDAIRTLLETPLPPR